MIDVSDVLRPCSNWIDMRKNGRSPKFLCYWSLSTVISKKNKKKPFIDFE